MAAVDKIEEKRKPEDFIGHRNRNLRTNKLIKSLIMRGFLDSLRKLRSLEMTRLGEITQNQTAR